MAYLSPVTADALDALPGIRHAFFTRPGGVSAGLYAGLNAGLGSHDNRDHVLENRRLMTENLQISSDRLASPYQIHSSEVVDATTALGSDRPKADGVVTSTSGLAVAVVTADCGPVLFADPNARVVAACHAGWKGALGGVLENTVASMVQKGADTARITAVLGPTISQQNYEVGPEFPRAFLDHSADNARFFRPSVESGHFMFDLTGYIVHRLTESGVSATAVNRCTYAENDNFYSYRRTTHNNEPDYGRQLSAIVLTEEQET